MNYFKKLFKRTDKPKEDSLKKFLIVGLGNIGAPYYNTRHNIGFKVLNSFVEGIPNVFLPIFYPLFLCLLLIAIILFAEQEV